MVAGHDFYEHVWGWSQVGALVLAAFAIYYAVRSAKDSKRSAEAAAVSAKHAEEAVAIAREELEMLRAQANRRPKLSLTQTSYPSGFDNSVVLQVGFANDGDADAFGTTVNIVFPVHGRIWKCDNMQETNQRELVIYSTAEDIDDSGRAASYVAQEIDIKRRVGTVLYYRMYFPSAGTYPVRVKAVHADDEVSRTFMVLVS